MNINIDITDQQAANLAALCRVRTFIDGKDLIKQAVANADLQASKQALIGALARTTDQGVLTEVTAAAVSAGLPVKPA